MKFKTTRKAIVNGSDYILSVGYCDLQYLLRYHSPIAYTSGVYGWNFDVYEVYGVTICTGYRGMPGKRANNVLEYNKKAESIIDDTSLTWQEQEEKLEELLQEFLKQA